MKHVLAGFAAALLLGAPALGEERVSINGAVPSAEACESAWRGADSPERAATVFVAALVTYEFDRETALDCMRRIVDEGYLSANGALSHDFDYLVEVGIARSAAIARSYIEGAAPENGYVLPEGPWTVRFERDARFDLGDGLYRVKVFTSGQPTTRPVTLRLDAEGHYRIHEASTLFVGVAAPAR
ncbi:hypothetical protein E5163_13245 [Marinicauda algicola]|uniref:DUF6935 domain-containing protein n=1 Tax=Marinicauda algicola TaxID=2029849 RepID=A0A4S2GXR6_9PROT|nr:hypothetical protein [Marinicauda algicola]TGY87876.1 hypothetical protein E5163_13245 [Marinicauda algicola]